MCAPRASGHRPAGAIRPETRDDDEDFHGMGGAIRGGDHGRGDAARGAGLDDHRADAAVHVECAAGIVAYLEGRVPGDPADA
jgi:hypothetical protein